MQGLGRFDRRDLHGGCPGKLHSSLCLIQWRTSPHPARRRACIDHDRTQMAVSERRVCRVLAQHRSTQRHQPRGRADEERLVAGMIELARQYGRCVYRRIAVQLRDAGWQVSDGRVERLWPFGMVPPLVRGPCWPGVEGPFETTEEEPGLAERRVMHSPQTCIHRPCLEL